MTDQRSEVEKDEWVLTLVGQQSLLDREIDQLDALRQDVSLDVSQVRPLGDGAVDVILPFQGDYPEAWLTVLKEALGDKIDACFQPAVHRAKKLMLCDMDSTIIQQECIDELADYAGVRDQISAVTERAMRGELDFEQALNERVAKLAGLELFVLQTCFDERITLTPGAKTLVQTLKSKGVTCLLVSGGFTFFTERVAEAAGFDGHRANVLLAKDGQLTGQVGTPILGREAKLETLEQARSDLGLAAHETLAVGDGANDSAMIEGAGLGVGYHPHSVLEELSDAVVKSGDLTTILYFLGIPQSEWITD